MKNQVDLHMHTSYSSDGDHSPYEILAMARDLRLRAISISDHDTVEGSQIAISCCRDYGLEVLPNVEFTTFLDGRELHILSYFLDIAAPSVLAQLTEIRKFDEMRIKELASVLQHLGVDVTYEEAKALSPYAAPKCSVLVKAAMTNGRNIGLPLFKEYVDGPKSDQPYHNFFLDYMRPGRPAYVEPLMRYSAIDAIVLIQANGGLPVLAHAGGSLKLPGDVRFIDTLRSHGLCGLEVYSSYHTQEDEAFLLSLSNQYDLAVTAGSDFHGATVKPNIRMGELRHNPYSLVENLKERSRIFYTA